MFHLVPAYWRQLFPVGPYSVDEMVAGHCGSWDDTERNNQSQLHSGAPASGQGGKEE